MKKLRVLVIDDSAYNRRTLTEILESHPEVEVVGKASDGEEGLKLANQLRPDLVTLDLEMPRMDGFTFLRILMAQMPTPVIVISSHSRKEEVFQALDLGALDFVAKPTHHISPDLAGVRDELLGKVMVVRALRALPAPRTPQATPPTAVRAVPRGRPSGIGRVVCIGASTGGPPALEGIFRALADVGDTAFLVAQHMPEKFTRAFAERMNRIASLEIREAEEGMVLAAGTALVAPGGQHLEVAGSADSGWRATMRLGTAADRYVPSVDALFISAARAFGKATLGVVLTGMGSDGRVGVEKIKAAGGRVVAESAETAVIYGMPKEAAESGCVDEVLPLPRIADAIASFARCRG
ncbi:MAG: chemotaxis response regulator protein-glutamate methylesterase [Deltaproteobacteria bacterium]|nr:chemotaxis response regulator protein-glutamate methylesterase [Deltaproteobacteria bacterium]